MKAETHGKYFPCDITYSPRIQAFKLTGEDIAELLADAGGDSLPAAGQKKFSEWMSYAIGSYKGEEIELGLRKISQIRRRLEHLRKHSFLLLTGFGKWEDIERGPTEFRRRKSNAQYYRPPLSSTAILLRSNSMAE